MAESWVFSPSVFSRARTDPRSSPSPPPCGRWPARPAAIGGTAIPPPPCPPEPIPCIGGGGCGGGGGAAAASLTSTWAVFLHISCLANVQSGQAKSAA